MTSPLWNIHPFKYVCALITIIHNEWNFNSCLGVYVRLHPFSRPHFISLRHFNHLSTKQIEQHIFETCYVWLRLSEVPWSSFIWQNWKIFTQSVLQRSRRNEIDISMKWSFSSNGLKIIKDINVTSKTMQFHSKLKDVFSAFFYDNSTFNT